MLFYYSPTLLLPLPIQISHQSCYQGLLMLLFPTSRFHKKFYHQFTALQNERRNSVYVKAKNISNRQQDNSQNRRWSIMSLSQCSKPAKLKPSLYKEQGCNITILTFHSQDSLRLELDVLSSWMIGKWSNESVFKNHMIPVRWSLQHGKRDCFP